MRNYPQHTPTVLWGKLELMKWGLQVKGNQGDLWCRGAELNRRHTDFQSVALPTELPRHVISN